MSKRLIALVAVLSVIIIGGVWLLAYSIGQNTNPEVEVTRVVTEQVDVPAELPTQYAVDPLAVAVGQANATQAEITRIQAEIVVAQTELKALVNGNATLSEIATKEAELNDLITRAEALIEQSGLEVDNLNELAEVAMTATAPSSTNNGDGDEEESTNPSGYNTVAIWDHNMAPGKFGPQCIAEYRLSNYAEFNPTFYVGHATDNNFGDSIDLFIEKNETIFNASTLLAAITTQMPNGGDVLVVDDRILGKIVGDLTEALADKYTVTGYNNCNEILSFAKGQ